MSLIFITFILTIVFHQFPVDAIGKCNAMNCSNLSIRVDCSSNPCNLGGYFSTERGYQCAQVKTDVVCICPNGGYELNQPCRMSGHFD